MTTKEKKRVRRLILSEMDMNQSLSWAKYILKNQLFDERVNSDSKVVGLGLQTAMIVAYIRPFSGNKPTIDTEQRPGLPLKEKLPPDLWDLHERLLERRNQVFAHTDAAARDLEVIVKDLGGEATVLPISNNPFVMSSKGELLNFIALVEQVKQLIGETVREVQKSFPVGEVF